jgi:hypothetical protein
MEEKMEFELPESGTFITFANSLPVITSGRLDPPAVESSYGVCGARVAERFETAESGIMIDFNRLKPDYPVIGFSRTPPSAPSFPVHTAPATQAFQAFEMSESGNLIVFPHQVELRRKQAAQMRSLEGVVRASVDQIRVTTDGRILGHRTMLASEGFHLLALLRLCRQTGFGVGLYNAVII